MLEFYDTPIFAAPVGPAPQINPTAEGTKAAIAAATTGVFPSSPHQLLPINIADLVASMWVDSGGGLSARACYEIVTSLVDSNMPCLAGKASIDCLPTHYRRTMSELLSCAVSLSVAGVQTSIAVQKPAFNGVGFPFHWGSLWQGNGPDYLVWDPNKTQLYFYEIKGRWGPMQTKPPRFAKHKTQSLNAYLGFGGTLIPVNAHVLSYGNFGPGQPLSVQWFNHREELEFERNWPDVILILALTQFLRDISAAGLQWLGANVFLDADPEEIFEDLMSRFSEDRDELIAFEGNTVILIEERAVTLFRDIAAFRRGLVSNGAAGRDNDEARTLLESLQRLMESRPVNPAGRMLFRLPTGLSFWMGERSEFYYA